MLRPQRRLVIVFLAGLAAVWLAVASAAGVPPDTAGWGRREMPYDGRFTFVRLRWRAGRYGVTPRGVGPNYWIHEFQRAEQNLMRILDDLTLIDANTEGSLVLTLDDPDLFRYPIAMLWEPGFWIMTDAEAVKLREYLVKGGFLIVNDFELDQWDNFEAQMKRVVPDGRWIKLDGSHRVFQNFFEIRKVDFPHPPNHHLFGYRPLYYGLFEDNDPSKRLMAIVNYNTNIAEYWQMAGSGFMPIDASNEAFKLGVNYMLYAMTH
jgi:hypothetical protein